MDNYIPITGRQKGLLQRRAALIASVTALTVASLLSAVVLLEDPVSPNYPLVVGLGLLAGLGVGAGVAFVWDRYSERLSEVEAATGLPVLGMIPRMRPEDADVVAVTASRAVEGFDAYGHLAAGLVDTLQQSHASCLLITSPTRKAGRTTIAVNLAASFAAEGMNVALISADPHGGRTDQPSGLRPQPGLSEVLDGSISLDSALQPSGIERLSVLPAGAPSDRGVVGYNPADLARLLDRLTNDVDLVVIDAPPVLGSLDTVLLAQEVDLVLVAVDVRRGRRSDASTAVSYLGHVEDKLIGCVANDPRRRSRRRANAPAPGTDRPVQVRPVSTVTRLRLRPWLWVGATAHALGAVSSSARGAARKMRGGLAATVRLRMLRRHRWVSVIATAATVAVVISTVWWLSYDDRSEAQQDVKQTPDTPLAAPAPSGQAAVDAAMEKCRSKRDAQAAPLEAAAASLDQWQVHVDAMNQLVAGEITLDQANAFWEQTRVQADRKVQRFLGADNTYADGQFSCRTPAHARNTDADLAGLSGCQHDIAQRGEALRASRVAIDTWHHHVMDMDMLRAGKMSPSRAVELWLMYWKQGVAELNEYRTELQQTNNANC